MHAHTRTHTHILTTHLLHTYTHTHTHTRARACTNTPTVCGGIEHWPGKVACTSATDSQVNSNDACDQGYLLVRGAQGVADTCVGTYVWALTRTAMRPHQSAGYACFEHLV